MTKLKQKLIITFSVIGVVLVLILSATALFSIKRINVDYLSSSDRIKAYSSSEVRAYSGIKKGKSILFANKARAIEVLEKKFPFAKFEIMRTFPSTMTIYLYERQPAFMVKNSEAYFEIYDEDLKCLDIVAGSNLAEYGLENVPTLSGANLNLCGEEGEFILDPAARAKISAILDGVYGAEGSNIGVMSDIAYSFDAINEMNITTFTLRAKEEGKQSGGKIVVQGDNYLKEKIAFALYLYLNISDKEEYRERLDKLEITVLRNFDPNDPSKKFVTLSVDGQDVSENVTQSAKYA